jgi:hypothetical protein
MSQAVLLDLVVTMPEIPVPTDGPSALWLAEITPYSPSPIEWRDGCHQDDQSVVAASTVSRLHPTLVFWDLFFPLGRVARWLPPTRHATALHSTGLGTVLWMAPDRGCVVVESQK